jgi:carbon-monoxide dehydrogenase medium subunit
VEEAVAALRDSGGDAAIYAGGTDLLVEIRNGVRSPDLLIDVKRIEELGALTTSEDEIRIGATAPLNRIAESQAVRRRLPALSDAALSIGTYQLRSRATLAGNLCNASPAADGAPILMTQGAVLTVAGPLGRRDVPVRELFAGVKRTSLAADEMVLEIRIPAREDGLRTAFLKQQRIRGHDLAVVNAAASLDAGGRVLTVAIGSCAPTPILLDPLDVSDVSVDAAVERVLTAAEGAVSPISDVRASADYRRAVLPVLLRRLCHTVLDPGGRS